MSAAANKDLVRRFVEEVLVGGDFAALAELTTCMCVDHAASAGQPGRLVSVARLMTAWRAAFPGLAITVEELCAAGNRVAARWTLSGTHRGRSSGCPPPAAGWRWPGRRSTAWPTGGSPSAGL